MTLAEYNLNDPPPSGTAPHQNHSPYLIKADSIIPRSCIAPSPSTASTSVAANSDFSFGDTSTSNYNHTKHDLPSILRKSSITDSCSSTEDPRWIQDFESTLEAVPNTNIRIIANAEQLRDLLQWYYHSRYNSGKSTDTSLFPYLHGLNNSSQRSFFTSGNDDPKMFPTLTQDFFNLMFINSSSTRGDCPNLINTIDSSELLVPKTNLTKPKTLDFTFDFEHKENINLADEYETFENLCSSSQYPNELNNRNFKDQIKLMASISCFVIYNYENLDNSTMASVIDSLKSNSNLIFVVSNQVNWNTIEDCFFELNEKEENDMYENEMIDTFKASESKRTDNQKFKARTCTNPRGKEIAKNSKFLNYEQNLIWRLNSMKWIMNDKICLGNIIDFNNLSSVGLDSNENDGNDFKLIINCHENASFPSLSLLETIFNDIKSSHGTNSTQVYYLEFPSSGSFNPEKINTLEILSFLNVLKLVHMLVERFDRNVFIYSFDGFTGLSLLTICIEQLFKCETVEDAIVSLLSDKTRNTKLYYFKTDLIFLKQFERLVNYLKHHSLLDSNFILGLNLQDVNNFHYQYIQRTTNVKYDWFNLQNDNNFPSKILPDLYLGSLNHANSVTILNSLGISHLISIGECPYWVKHLKDDFIFDFKEPFEIQRAIQKNITIISPIYEFNDGKAKIYEVNFDQFPNRTKSKHVPKSLQNLVFIHNLKDDGKDSFSELLMKCPENIQTKILLGSSKRCRETAERSQDRVSLIHCRIGVSRSASLVLASLMKRFQTNLLTSYIYLRVQRFNIIIQPNLRLFHELYQYEEYLGLRNEANRGYNWEVLCNEVFKLNNHYI